MIGMASILSVPVSGPFTVALLSMSLIGPALTSSFSRIRQDLEVLLDLDARLREALSASSS